MWPNLNGAVLDGDDVRCTLEDLRFSVEGPWLHLTAAQIRDSVEKFVKRVASLEVVERGPVVFYYGGHGDKESIVGVDGALLSFDDLQDIFANSMELAGHPKVFVLDCCRGCCRDKGYPSSAALESLPEGRGPDNFVGAESFMLEKVPSHADMFVCYATPKGHVAYNTKQTDEQGRQQGLFTKKLIDRLRQAGHKRCHVCRGHCGDLGETMVEVNADVGDERCGPLKSRKRCDKQASGYHSSLRKHILLAEAKG